MVRAASPRRVVLVPMLALALLTAACGGSEGSTGGSTSETSPGDATGATLPQPVQTLDIDGADYTFTISPDPAAGVKPGWTLVRFRNVGAEAHQVMFARIKDGVDMGELAAAGAGDSSGAGAIDFVDMIGGVSYIDPDRDITAMVNLTPGITMAMCYVPDAEGVAHALMGMSTMLNVAETPGAMPASGPAPREEAVRGTIELSADGYQVPDDLQAGWYHVRNTDTVLHELSLLRLAEPIDEREVQPLVEALASNQTPSIAVEAMGGMGAISAGFDGYLYLDLAPGPYLAVDFMPDPGEPRPHMLDGYYSTFDV